MLNKDMFLDVVYAQGKTCAACAEEIGVSKNTFTKYLNNRKPFDSVQVLQLCNFLGISDSDTKVNIFLAQMSHS